MCMYKSIIMYFLEHVVTIYIYILYECLSKFVFFSFLIEIDECKMLRMVDKRASTDIITSHFIRGDKLECDLCRKPRPNQYASPSLGEAYADSGQRLETME